MEVTKQVGDPDPSGPQGHPSAIGQPLGGGPREPQGRWRNSGSLCFGQGLGLPAEAVPEGPCGPASQAPGPEPVRQLPGDPAEGSARCGSEQVFPGALRLSSSTTAATGPWASPSREAQVHLVLDDHQAVPLPWSGRRDSSEGLARPGGRGSWLQVQGAREGKSPSKVLVGWGKGPGSSSHQRVPWGVASSQRVPCFLSGETGSAAAQCQGQGHCWCQAQASPAPAPTWANTPAPPAALTPLATACPTCSPHDLLGSLLTKDLPRGLLGEGGRPWSGLLESCRVVTFCQDKVVFGAQRLSAPAPDHAPEELQAARRPSFLKPPETPAEKPLFYTYDLDSPPPAPGRPGTPRSQRSRQDVSAQPEGQPLRASHSTCSRAPLPATCPAAAPGLGPRPAPPPQAAPSAPTCQQLQDATAAAEEGHVLVFDMDTGSTRMGLLCHDTMGSRAVLVGRLPHPPPASAPDHLPAPARPSSVPAVSPNVHRSSFWPLASELSSPVPSSVSSGSFREVALGPKEAQLHLESRGGSGSETPVRVGLLPAPSRGGVPFQAGERTLSRVQDAAWSKPVAEKSEPTRTIWILGASGMQEASAAAGQAGGLQGTASEQAAAQEPSVTALPGDAGRYTQQEAGTADPRDPRAEGPRQGPLGGWPPSGEPPPSPGQPPLSGAPPARQRSLSRRPSFGPDPTLSKEPLLPRGAPSSPREAGQALPQCQEGEALALPIHVGLLRVPLPQENTCVYVSRDAVGTIGVPPGASFPWLSPWPPGGGGSHRALADQLSLVTFTAPGPGYQVLPTATAGAAAQGPRLKLTAEDSSPEASLIASLSLLCGGGGAYYALQPPPPLGPSPGLCGPPLGHFQSPAAAVVIDTGSGFTKCGLAGEDHVLSVVPSRVQLLQPPAPGQPRYAMLGAGGGRYSVLHRGVVSDWDALEVLWQHLFYCKLGMRPEELAVLVADSPVSPRTNREKVAEILFERFQVPAMQAVQQGLLALYAYGRTTGLVLGSGHGTSYVAPVLTGDPAPLDTYRLDVAGADLTEYLAELLLAAGQAPPRKAGLLSRLKEACCYVALDPEAELARAQAQPRVDFVLPDKQVVSLGSERFRCPEALFQPQLLGLPPLGLPQLALRSISRLEARQQEQLLANVVLDGGSTLVRGFPERLRRELGPRATVLGSPHRAVAAWLGGSIMASRDSFQSLWLSRREYEEEGPWAIYKYRL